MFLDLSSLMTSEQLREEKDHKVTKMSYLLRKWQVMMWKNLIVRKRHWFLTLFEIVIPILLFWAVAVIRQKDLFPKKAVVTPETIYPVVSEDELINLSFHLHDTFTLAYTPQTQLTERLIKEFNKTFVSKIEQEGRLESFTAFDTELKMEEFFHNKFENQSTFSSERIGYGIVFENIGNNSSLPKDFKYKIRSTVPHWDTKDLFPQFLPGGPSDQGDNYLYKGFVAIQIAIDAAYRQLAGIGTQPTYNVSVQKYPFPEYKTDLFNELFKSLMPFFTMLSFITISISVLKKVVEEKASGVQELMKMMGLQTWMVWASWVLNGLMVYIISCTMITFFLCLDHDPAKGPVIAYVHFTIIFTLFLFFCVGSIFFCFAISAFFQKPTMAMTTGMTLWLLSYTILQQYIGSASVPFWLHLVLCLVPTYNMCTGYIVIAAFESREVTITWLNLFSSATGGGDMSLGIVMVMFIVQSAFYMLITYYVTSIYPGPYGRAKPWHFIFKLPARTDKRRNAMLNTDDDDEDYERYEAPPKDLRVGLKIKDLRKVFSNNVVAVDRVNLDIYEGQITALLGHNGAGKTTTMSILTGMYSPTAGSVYAKDYNVFENMDRFRNSLGLCPQHDLLFPYLTAIEHLVFFGMLKGMSKKMAHSEGMKLLQLLHISEKRSVLAEKLSGGMKRKLSLAVALIGSPQVLVLDEPTSGMDPESRREMWDLLLSLRGERTILITTHFMEEADVLGDRIAIMDHGKVKCYGTTLFLKRIYGTGYHLTMIKEPQNSLQPITDTVKEKVVGAELKSAHATQVAYTVPQEEASKLPAMFATLESKKFDLGIKAIGISCTTMEEVFLKVGQLAREEKYENSKTSSLSREPYMHRNTSNEALTYKKLKGLPLIKQQFTSLIYKRCLFTTRRPITTLVYIVIPLLLTWMTVKTGLVDIMKSSSDPPLSLSLSQYGKTEEFINGPPGDVDVFKLFVKEQGCKATTVDTDLVTYLLDKGKANVAYYKTQIITAVNFNTNNNTVTALYNGIAYHAAPISVNVLSNTLLRSHKETSGNTITTINHPLDVENFVGSCTQLNDVSLWMGALIWLVLIPMGVKGFMNDFIAFPHKERTSNAKQLQLMTGVTPQLYWFACFLWDYFVYLVCCIAMLAVILIMDTNSLFTETRDYAVLVLILLLYGVSGICCTYLYSFLGKSSTMSGTIFTLITLITGLIAPLVMHFLLRLSDPVGTIVSSSVVKPLHYLLCLEPQYAFGAAIMNFAYLLSLKSGCKQCESREVLEPAGMCKEIQPYLEFSSNEKNPNGILEFVLFLAFDWVVYMGIILLIEYGYMSHAIHWLKVQWVGKEFDKLPTEDADVRDERDRVDAARMNRDDSVVLTADGLAKKFSRSFAAVQGISFTVSAGECFGLLGVNGAGKTTTFRMLTGDENPTAGSARILHYDIAKNRTKYLAQVGYCPQFDGINEFLTGEEVLRLFANLRGIPFDLIQPQIDEWISLLGLDEYRHRKCGKYSGGNKRKLSTAMALIGDPPVVFLDEPTTGVDPVARRNLWDVLTRCQKSGQAIVLTSHSMEECEALCTRLTIMVRGRMKCIGSIQYLKQRYGQGYTIMIKLNTHPNELLLLEHLKNDMHKTFNCTIKDQHKGLLHYHIDDTSIPLSQLFDSMERVKQDHSLVEDYSVGDTTLEQVFIAFARQPES